MTQEAAPSLVELKRFTFCRQPLNSCLMMASFQGSSKRRSSDASSTASSSHMESQEQNVDAVVQREPRDIDILRVVVLILLITIATLASVGVYYFALAPEKEKFRDEFKTNSKLIIDSFQESVARDLGAIHSMSTSITSYVVATQQEFPFVTIPHFVLRGSDLRVQADALIVHWMPLVTNEKRNEWEEYAMANRAQIDEAFIEDEQRRKEQDALFQVTTTGGGASGSNRVLQGPPAPNETVFADGSGFHPRIWSTGAVTPRGDEPEGEGPFLPLWQRSPINQAKQRYLNINFVNSYFLSGIKEAILNTEEAVMTSAEIPVPEFSNLLKANLALSHYRDHAEEYLDDPVTFLMVPVFSTFDTGRKLAGMLGANIYWKLRFKNILPSTAVGYLCVLENSYNQTFAFQLDGSEVSYLGEGNPFQGEVDRRYEEMEASANTNDFVQAQASPQTRSYIAVPLSRQYGQYTLRVYPSSATEDIFLTKKPWVYTIVVVSVFLVTSAVLLFLDRVVARRQRLVMDRVTTAASKAAAAERALNEFLAHEVRNPLAAAITANGFVAAAAKDISEAKIRTAVQEDVDIVGNSLNFIDDFLRSMLDVYRSKSNKLEIHLSPTDILKDVFEPILHILHRRDNVIKVKVDCPENIIVMTDCLRLKQVMMNLGRNSVKFTSSGWIQLRAVVVDGIVELCVEDTGAGIPESKRDSLFDMFQTSLDVLSQGTGIGLSLCKSLTELLNADIYLDEKYDSGVEGSPGARFVVKLNTPPISLEKELAGSAANLQLEKDVPNQQYGHNGDLCGLPENLSILFVDDDTILRKLFSRAVSKAAPTWSIKEAASGESALRLIETTTFDLVFMDQYMSSTSKTLLGTDTVRAMRSDGCKSKICGLSANDIEQEFVDAGADCFMMKPLPCKEDEMRCALLRILQSSGRKLVFPGQRKEFFEEAKISEGETVV